MGLVIRTWNLYHGRTHPKTGRTYLERMVRLASLDAPDVVAAREHPFEVLLAGPALLQVAVEHGLHRLHGPARERPVRARIEIGEPVEDGETCADDV